MRNFILKGHTVVIENDAIKWGEWFAKADRIVKQEVLPSGYFVSTVFLGVDHSFGFSKRPLLFETMVFKSEESLSDVDMSRYSTWEEAEKGHKEMVKTWKKI